ncbi:hypothetical protein ACFQBQ_00740 [Granulicella cerasi]|uniref:Uncharacterized protein n=1 Tax=Granulicella cerasi TaxID=741063 RepID=A0ABW1Z4S6_9BACT|nr:hypothetical protein [Granulicella cerasi]
MSEHNPLLPTVYLDIAGKKRKLLFDFNAIIKVEELTGINLLQAVVSDLEAKNIRALLYASLLHDEPNLTIEEVGSWITLKNLANIRTAINTAWFASIEDIEKIDDDSSSGEAETPKVEV